MCVTPRILPSGRAYCALRVLVACTHIYTYTRRMRFTFDPAKRIRNLKKHGFDLADARPVIESGKTVTFEDRRFEYGEERFVTLGFLHEALVLIVTAETTDEIRVISMRKAEKHEETIYVRYLD
jgi:uncharacterized DUF497 family protein